MSNTTFIFCHINKLEKLNALLVTKQVGLYMNDYIHTRFVTNIRRISLAILKLKLQANYRIFYHNLPMPLSSKICETLAHFCSKYRPSSSILDAIILNFSRSKQTEPDPQLRLLKVAVNIFQNHKVYYNHYNNNICLQKKLSCIQ